MKKLLTFLLVIITLTTIGQRKIKIHEKNEKIGNTSVTGRKMGRFPKPQE